MYAKKSLEKTTCVTKVIYYIFMQKCSKICTNLFHYATRERKYVHVMILTAAYLSAIRLNILSKRHSQAGTCTQHWENVYLLCGYVDEHQLSVQNVCYLFFYSLDFDMEWQQWKPAAETTQPRKRDLRCSPLCCQWKWLSGHNNWWAEIKYLQMDECIKIYWWILNHSKNPFFVCVPMFCKICVYNCTLKAMGREESKQVLWNLQLNSFVSFGEENANL